MQLRDFGIPLAYPESNNEKMITLLLLLAMLIFCWLMYKSIDWFEKI